MRFSPYDEGDSNGAKQRSSPPGSFHRREEEKVDTTFKLFSNFPYVQRNGRIKKAPVKIRIRFLF